MVGISWMDSESEEDDITDACRLKSASVGGNVGSALEEASVESAGSMSLLTGRNPATHLIFPQPDTATARDPYPGIFVSICACAPRTLHRHRPTSFQGIRFDPVRVESQG